MDDLLFSIYRLRRVGYVLVLLSFLDTLAVLYPPNLLNPAWELQTIGSIVERVPVSLLGLALIFLGEEEERQNFEEILLKFLSWFCLVLAIVFLLMLPLGVFNTLKINSATNKQLDQRSSQELSQIQDVEERLKQGTNQELKVLAEELNRMGMKVDLNQPEDLRKQILSRIVPAKQQLKNQVEKTRQTQRNNLFKNAVKWFLGALLSSALFFSFWKGTNWAR